LCTLLLVAAPLAAAWHAPLATASRPVTLMTRNVAMSASPTAASVGAAFVMTRPLKLASAVFIGAALYGASELNRRNELIAAGENCMEGDDQSCEVYDEAVEEAPFWKLKLVASKLVRTNRAYSKLQSAPPDGFEWGIIV
jgi:hypothetical protein